MFEVAQLENWNATPFAGELAEFCGPRTPDQAALDRQVQYLRRKITPTTEHKIWVAIKAHEICRNYQGSPLAEQGVLAFKAMNDRRNAEASAPPPPEQWRALSDDRVVRAETVGQLWTLARRSFAGAVGADYFGIEPTRRTNDPQRSASLSRAQTVAIMRLRCDMTHACGPEQLDSLLVCARYFQCRPGISVEEVWRSVASPYELQAAQAIYQQYVAMRSARRGAANTTRVINMPSTTPQLLSQVGATQLFNPLRVELLMAGIAALFKSRKA